MSLTLSGKDFNNSGSFVQIEAGNYACNLKGVSAYLNNKYQSEELQNQLTFIWDTGLVGENDKGEEVDVLIFDSFINLTLNEKGKLIERITALVGPVNADTVNLGLNGLDSFDQLTHMKEGRFNLEGVTVDGKQLFGLEALVNITINDKGYPKVTSVTAPVRQPANGRMKPRAAAAEAPAGVPT